MPFSKSRDQWIETEALDTHTGQLYPITLLDPGGRTTKIEVKCYGNILGAYREHPEAKFVDHQGNPADGPTRGLLRRRHVIAQRHRYIGKETSRHWEQGKIGDRRNWPLFSPFQSGKRLCKISLLPSKPRPARFPLKNRQTPGMLRLEFGVFVLAVAVSLFAGWLGLSTLGHRLGDGPQN